MTSPEPTETRSRRSRLIVLALTAAGLGAISIGVALASQEEPAQPPDSTAGAVTSSPSTTPDATPGATPDATPGATPGATPDVHASSPPDSSPDAAPLAPSEPESLSIPAIDVSTDVFSIGKADDGTLEVPQPGPNLHKAAWFENSPTPGQPGPSVIEGHVDTSDGPSVFFRLGDLRPGDDIEVTREDGTIAVFTVTELRNFPKDEFPTSLVYGGDLGEPTLRLITCSDFDDSTGHHTGNLIAFADLTSVQRSP